MCGAVLHRFVHITAFPDIDRSADALYNQNKEVMLLCQLNTFLSVLNAIIKLTFLLADIFYFQKYIRKLSKKRKLANMVKPLWNFSMRFQKEESMLKLHCIYVRNAEIWKCFLNYQCIFRKANYLKRIKTFDGLLFFLSKENPMLPIEI